MMDAAERALLEATVRDALARATTESDAPVDGVLADLGWLEMLDAEPRDAIDVVFTALGATNATASALDDVVVSALGLEPRSDLALLLPPFGATDAPARVDGLATARVATAKELVGVVRTSDELRIATVPTESVTSTPIHGVDPDAGFNRVHTDASDAFTETIGTETWMRAIAAGRRAVAHQIAGACRTMLALACEHAREREQFGRPIARFQAVRHRLADALVAVESIDAALGAAWDEPNPTTAALAKAVAGRSAKVVATQCQQVLAGIGFTTDHPFHRYFKRTLVLDGLFGTSDAIVAALGHELLAARAVPTLIEL
jgi:Acyl-CoA dehydrogenase, C-terminal domain